MAGRKPEMSYAPPCRWACAALIAVATALPATAQTTGRQPVLVPLKRMALDIALKAAQAAIEACRAEGVQVAVTVVDRGGHPQAILRDKPNFRGFRAWRTGRQSWTWARCAPQPRRRPPCC